MKKFVGVGILVFTAVLAITVGYRMSADAMAVVIGVVVGVLASIPMSAVILIITQRQRREEAEARWTPQRQTPPVVVIQGGQMAQRPEWLPQGAVSPFSQTPIYQAYPVAGVPAALGAPARQFKVIGDDWSVSER